MTLLAQVAVLAVTLVVATLLALAAGADLGSALGIAQIAVAAAAAALILRR